MMELERCRLVGTVVLALKDLPQLEMLVGSGALFALLQERFGLLPGCALLGRATNIPGLESIPGHCCVRLNKPINLPLHL